MKKIILILFMATIINTGFSAAIDGDFLDLSQSLTKAYYYSGIGETNEAIPALETFYDKWDTFYSDYYYYNWNDTSWKSDFDDIDALAETLTNEIENSTLNSNTVSVLSDIQGIIRTIRIRNEQENIIDYIIEFEEPMAMIITEAEDFDPDNYTDEELKEIKALSGEIFDVWQHINNYEITEEDFETDEEKLEALAETMFALNELLTELKSAFTEQEVEQISKSIEELESYYLEILLAFADLTEDE